MNAKIVAGSRRRTYVEDRQPCLKYPISTALSPKSEAIIIAFRLHTLRLLENRFNALQASIPYLTCSSLHRCLRRHGTRQLPEVDAGKPKQLRFTAYLLSYFHINPAEVHPASGRIYPLFASTT